MQTSRLLFLGIFFFSPPTDSYLRRDAMCSSHRPPSSSLMMYSLSFSSCGRTGKLLRKMSGRNNRSKNSHHAECNIKARLVTVVVFYHAMKRVKKQSADKGSFYLITFPQMPGGNTQICIPSSGKMIFFYFFCAPPFCFQENSCAVQGKAFITLWNWWRISQGIGEMIE